MSTRCTISYDDDWHLYQECFEYDNVYLRLDGSDWAASLETQTIDWRDGDSDRPRLHLKMDVTMWRKIVEGWLESQWGQNPEDDHRKLVVNLDNIRRSRVTSPDDQKNEEFDKEELP